MKTLAELATEKLYNRVIFYAAYKNIDLTDYNALDLLENFAIQDYYGFEEFINNEVLDDDELFNFCLDNASKENDEDIKLYHKLHKILEEQGFDLV